MNPQNSYTLAFLANFTGSKLIGNPDKTITDIAELDVASDTDASFLANRKYLTLLKQTKAGVVFIDDSSERPQGLCYLISVSPSLAFQKVVSLFRPHSGLMTGFKGIHPTAVIHETARVGQEVTIGPYCVIDQDVVIGDHTTMLSGSYIGPFCHIGSACLIHPHVTVRERCIIGNRVVLQPGAVIGSCGYGFATDDKGNHQKLEQTGNVVIEDDVEIGANTTIDRARLSSTIIGKGSKIDNLVQIAHNVRIGSHNLIVAQCGIAGSSKTGSYVVMAGQTAMVGHIQVANGTMVAARGALSKSVTTPGGKYAGAPAIPLTEYNRQQVLMRNIEKLYKRVEELEKQISKEDS